MGGRGECLLRHGGLAADQPENQCLARTCPKEEVILYTPYGRSHFMVPALLFMACALVTDEPVAQPKVFAMPDAFKTLVNPECSHCLDEAKRRAHELKPDDRV